MPRRHGRLLPWIAVFACLWLAGCDSEEPGHWPEGEITGAIADDPTTPTGEPSRIDAAHGSANVRIEFTEAVQGVHEAELIFDLDDAACADGSPAGPQDIRVGASVRIDHKPNPAIEDTDPWPLRATAVELDCGAA